MAVAFFLFLFLVNVFSYDRMVIGIMNCNGCIGLKSFIMIRILHKKINTKGGLGCHHISLSCKTGIPHHMIHTGGVSNIKLTISCRCTWAPINRLVQRKCRAMALEGSPMLESTYMHPAVSVPTAMTMLESTISTSGFFNSGLYHIDLYGGAMSEVWLWQHQSSLYISQLQYH